MTPPPAQVLQWLKRTYPRPTVDPEWLEGCYTWIEQELHLDTTRDMSEILNNVDTQLLESSFSDSMVAGTGFPPNVLNAKQTFLEGPILVEVIGIMEIGHSAYSLLQIYESRQEYRKQADLRAAGGDADVEGQKPMPKYPRSMLQLQLSDGVSTLPAVESVKLPEFELGETPLGYKMIIKNVWIRHGIALLKPECVELKGHHTADRDEQRDAIFIRALKERLGEPLEDEPAAAPEPAGAPAPEHAPAQAAAPVPRSPLREISPPPAGAEAGPSQSPRRIEREHDDDAGQPRRRKRPSRAGRSPSLEPPPREAALQRSRYFSGPAGDVNGSASSETGANAAAATDDDGDRVRVETGEKRAMQDLARAIGLSQPRQAPLHLPSSDDDDENPFAPNASLPGAKKGADKGKGKGRAEPVFGEPGSEDYDFDFDFDDSFLEQVDRVEEEARLRAAASNPNGHGRANVNVNGKSDAQAPTQVKAEPRSQSVGTNKSLLSAATTLVGTQRPPAHRARSGTPAATAGVALGTSVGGGGVDVPMEVIDISDDEVEGDKENVPAPTRHVRRRVAPTLVDEDVIELSD